MARRQGPWTGQQGGGSGGRSVGVITVLPARLYGMLCKVHVFQHSLSLVVGLV